jgi:tetratricopeptide (TPR) repeat protein
MMTLAEIDLPRATDGEIAALNLESARRRSWARLAQDARLPRVAEAIVDFERLAAQFLGDLDALDRLEALAFQFAGADDSPRAALVQAEVASTAHRFADARDHLSRAASLGAPREEIDRHLLSIDQACGVELDAVLAARRRIAAASGRLEDLVPLGAVLADLERFDEADAAYRQAFSSYDDVSPFPPLQPKRPRERVTSTHLAIR